MRNLTMTASMLLVATALGCETDDGPPSNLEDYLEQVDQAVQWEYHEEFRYDKYTGLQDSTGAVFDPILDGAGNQITIGSGWPVRVRSTCGLTFVTPHYAITAAHCVDENNVQGAPMTVRTYNINSADMGALADARKINTTGPTYSWPYWKTQKMLMPSDGYYSTVYSNCELVARCDVSSGWMHDLCQLGATGGSFSGIDIAMIHCPSRPSSSDYVPVAETADLHGGPICNHWFHEVVENMPLSKPTTPFTADEYERWERYTYYVSPKETNYHYLDSWGKGGWKQLIPVSSRPRRDGTEHAHTGTQNNKVTYTDLWGCHGTSGSGVFEHQFIGRTLHHWLLGPVSNGAGASWIDRLCMDADSPAYGPMLPSITYVNLKFTQALADQAYMLDPAYPDGPQFYDW